MDALVAHLKKSVARRSLGQDALIWICRERKDAAAKVFGPEVGAAVLNLLEEDHLADGPRKTTRLQSFFVDHKDLLPDLVATMDVNEARNFGRRLMECPVFGELDRKSLMARVIKAQPQTHDLVSGERKEKRHEDLIVSWESLKKRQEEFDDLVRTRIPQNTKDIAIARSYGDLRENFEYKSAKQMQAVLQRRKRELQQDLDRARGTDFKIVDTSAVNIGTIVTLVDEDGERIQWSVLGAWDSDPEDHKISYLTEFGAALLGSVPGDHVEARDPLSEKMKRFTVESIAPYNP
jgi:transcription elongation GreA/GreB family factor